MFDYNAEFNFNSDLEFLDEAFTVVVSITDIIRPKDLDDTCERCQLRLDIYNKTDKYMVVDGLLQHKYE